MTDKSQKEIDYKKVFINSIHYGMVNVDEVQFLRTQFNEIEDEINLALEFLDKENFGDKIAIDTNGDLLERTQLEYIKTYAVAVLPFMIFDGKLIDPKIETKKSHEQALQFLTYISENRFMANHLIATITSDKSKEGHPPILFDDFKGFDIDKVLHKIKSYKFLSQLDTGREKRTWWGSSGALERCMCFTNSVYLAWSKPMIDAFRKTHHHIRKAEQDRIIYFIENFFKHMGYPISDNTIKTHFYNKVKKDIFILGNPYFIADNILI